MENVQIIPEKGCTKCGEIKPATFDYFAKHDKCLYGVNSICKECVKLQYRENRDERLKQVKKYYHNNKEEIKIKQKAYREENRDDLLAYSRNYYKENSEELNRKNREHYQENRDEILEYKKQYREENRDMVLEQGRQHYHRKGKYTEAKWRKENPEKVKKHSLDYYYRNKEKCQHKNGIYRVKNRDKLLKYNKKWYQENKEKHSISSNAYYEKVKDTPEFKENQREYQRNYVRQNKEIFSVKYHKRAALKRNLINDFSYNDWEECLEFFNHKDAYTGLSMELASQDHVIPISKKGHYTKNNIIPCEKSINSSKRDNDMEEWFKQQPFFSEQRLSRIYEWIDKNSD